MRGTRNVYYVKKESRLFEASSTKILKNTKDPIYFFSFFCCFDFDDFLG